MILDTNALSALADGDENLGHCLAGVAIPAIPAIVLGEFRFGIRASRLRSRYERWLDGNQAAFAVLAIEADTSCHYAEVRHGLKTRGTPIPENDIWIAALGRQHRLPILTRDQHFTLIPEIEVRSW